MFMAHIGGYDSVQVFSEDREKAKKKAKELLGQDFETKTDY